MRVVDPGEVHGIAARLRGLLGGETGHCIAGGGCWATVKGFIEDLVGVSVEALEVPVETWSARAHLEPAPPWALAPPMQLSSEVEGEPVIVEGDPSEPSSWLGGDYRGRVVIAPFPESPDDLKAAALLAADHGAAALILESPVPRVIVGSGYWGYSFHAGAPMPVPIVVVPGGYSSVALRAGRVSVSVEASVSEARDYILVVFEGEPGPLYGAHHDSWFHGFSDNVLGVAQAVSAFTLASSQGRGAGLVVFAAEEHGAPGAASWYWAWGSRYYAGVLERSDIDSESMVYVNFDVAGLGGCLAVSGSPQLIGPALEAGLRLRRWECPECDSMSLAMAGFATLSLHSLWCEGVRGVYHTPLDTPERTPPEAAALAVKAALKASLSEPDWGAFRAMLEEALGSGPALARSMLYRILSAAARAGWPRLYRELARRFLKPVHLGSYRYDTGDLEALWFPSVAAYRRLLEGLRGGRPPLEVWVAGEERLLYSTAYSPGTPTAPRGSLSWQLEFNLRRDLEGLEEALRGLIA